MNHDLHSLANELELSTEAGERLRLQFTRACVERVAHLLQDPEVVRCARGLGRYLDGEIGREELDRLAGEAASLANHHQGSTCIDGCGHAAVSATYATAHALAGRALQAADYAAYAVVYGEGGHGAVADRESFEPEYRWQVRCLASLGQAAAQQRT
jgi:hypothetical protein